MTMISLKAPVDRDLKAGEFVLLAGPGPQPVGLSLATSSTYFSLRAGDELGRKAGPVFRVHGVRWAMSEPAAPAARCALLQACEPVAAGKSMRLNRSRSGYSIAWITLSDKGSRGERVDTAGPLAAQLVGLNMSVALSTGFLLPDEEPQLRAMLADLALVQGYDLIVTSGGTGVAPRDITPEATLAVIDKRLPGFERAMTAASLEKTPHAVISRAVAGTLGSALIVNLPGSPKAVRECLEPLLPALDHTLKKLQGDPSDCAQQ